MSIRELAQLFPQGGIVRRLVEGGLLDEKHLPRNQFAPQISSGLTPAVRKKTRRPQNAAIRKAGSDPALKLPPTACGPARKWPWPGGGDEAI